MAITSPVLAAPEAPPTVQSRPPASVEAVNCTVRPVEALRTPHAEGESDQVSEAGWPCASLPARSAVAPSTKVPPEPDVIDTELRSCSTETVGAVAVQVWPSESVT